MKTLLILITAGALAGCATTTYEQDIAFYEAQKRFYTGDRVFAGYYLDRNNKVRPFYMP